uniref:Large ribosomal subunit protein bL33c n=1 Tax=Flintiella sanguinaria TaxID=101926 RepID=A0A1X9PUI5_9RHOD|nr:50S ribosomal protein L33 [Flintiella sanguinaria]
MAKSKGARIIITLECTSCRTININDKRKAGVFRYTTNKNRKNTPTRLELKKFCPNCNSHIIFKEIK